VVRIEAAALARTRALTMKRAKKHPLPPKQRDPVARSPLLKKGGAHGKTRAAERRAATMALAKTARDPEGDA